MTKLDELLKQKKELYNQSSKLREKANEIDEFITNERQQLIIDSGLISKPQWKFEYDIKSSIHYYFSYFGDADDESDWEDEFLNLSCAGNYHYTFDIIPNVLDVCGSDGCISLRIAKDKVEEVIKKFKLKICVKSYEDCSLDKQIESLKKTKELVNYILSL